MEVMDSKDLQVRALLTHRAFELCCQVLNVSTMDSHSYKKVFTVTREEIDHWIAVHGLPHWNEADGTHPYGWANLHLYTRALDGQWTVSWEERGELYEEGVFEHREDAEDALVTLILNSAGTGIDFSRN